MQLKKTLIVVIAVLLFPAGLSLAATGEVALRVEIAAPSGAGEVRLWLPYPLADRFQSIENIRAAGDYTSAGVYRIEGLGNAVLYAEWTRPQKKRRLLLRFRVTTTERSAAPAAGSESVKETVDEKIKEIALSVASAKESAGKKALALYRWVIDNMRRDPTVEGCGLGDVEAALSRGGGKCADISAVYVALLRAAGVPARKVYGLRLGRGKNPEDITGSYHCWAEFFDPARGWVPADPSDVIKFSFGKDASTEEKYIKYFFGRVDEYRIVLTRGAVRSLRPPAKSEGPPYFMYPYVEVDGEGPETLLDGKRLKLKITFSPSR